MLKNGKVVVNEINQNKQDGFISNFAFSLKKFGELYKEAHHASVIVILWPLFL